MKVYNLSKNTLKLYDVTQEEYEQWCYDNHKKLNSKETRKEFFEGIRAGSIVRTNGKIIYDIRSE